MAAAVRDRLLRLVERPITVSPVSEAWCARYERDSAKHD
jgi:hypothetical protein